MKTIAELTFGYNDAREYLAPESQSLLQKFFLEDSDLDELTQPQRYFLIGEKGSGKTAYAAYLSNWVHRNLKGHMIFVQDTDYLGMHSIKLLQAINISDYVSNWELVLLAVAFQRIASEPGTYAVIDPTGHGHRFGHPSSGSDWL